MSQRQPITGKDISPIFAVIAALMLIGGGISSALTYQFLNQATRTIGTITKIDRAGNHPIVSYQTAQGQAMTFSLKPTLRLKHYDIGDQVVVLYHPDHFGGWRHHIDTWGSIWIEAIGFMWLFTSFTIANIYLRTID